MASLFYALIIKGFLVLVMLLFYIEFPYFCPDF